MNYELYLCILPISILFVTVGIPNLINYIYIIYMYVCVCYLCCSCDVLFVQIDQKQPKN